MRFTIVQSKTALPVEAFDFLPPGGTIGRSQDNDLVLPDDERAISRLQALVHISNDGECRLTNHGSVTSVVVNGIPLERGRQVLLQHGDSLAIGDYLLAVNDPARASRLPGEQDDPLVLFEAGLPMEDDPLGILQEVTPIVTDIHLSDSLARHSRNTAARLDIDPLPPRSERLSGATSENCEALIQAFLDGMGLDNGRPTDINEEQMRTTGRMLSLFSQGTVALLSSRSILKRGVKAEMTMILNEANNPFKILPSGKTVLMQIYQSKMPGFMPPELAVRDALVDLQAHQLGMIAGIRAIIAAMLQSFNPQRLEEQAKAEGLYPKLPFSLGRKAAMWDNFNRHYQRTAGEIEDDFHTLFGEAFLHAYDVEVNQYKDSQTQADEP